MSKKPSKNVKKASKTTQKAEKPSKIYENRKSPPL